MDLMLFDDAAALAPPRVLREDLPGGGFILRSPEPLQPFVRCIGEWLEHWADTTPDAVFLAERDATGGWRQLTYRQTRDAVGRLAQAQLDLNLPADKPVVILSDNSVDHALLILATMHLGRVACTVSSAYCRLTKDFEKIHAILDALDPGSLNADDEGLLRLVSGVLALAMGLAHTRWAEGRRLVRWLLWSLVALDLLLYRWAITLV